MAIRDLGLPVGSVIALTGSTTIPPNFRALDGTLVVSGGRSLLEGRRLPNWNNNAVCPVGGSTSTGAVIPRVQAPSATLAWGNFSRMAIDTPIGVLLSSIGGGADSTGNVMQSLTYAPYFVQPVPYSDQMWLWSNNGSFTGDGYRMVNSPYSNVHKTQDMTHTHTANALHRSYHSFGRKSGASSYVLESTTNVVLTLQGNSTYSTTALPLTYNLTTNIGVWVMRIY